MALLAVGTAQAQSAPIAMTANPDRSSVGEPVTFTITKTNVLPLDHDWHVRDFLPMGVEFVSAISSQGSCTLENATELGIPSTDVNSSGVVQCDLGTISSGDSATMDITVALTVPGEITTYGRRCREPGLCDRYGGVELSLVSERIWLMGSASRTRDRGRVMLTKVRSITEFYEIMSKPTALHINPARNT